jgi:hypothetical protein
MQKMIMNQQDNSPTGVNYGIHLGLTWSLSIGRLDGAF